MARKIRKTNSNSIPPAILFVELLIPWIVMGIVAVALVAAGISGITVLVVALASAVATTFFIRYYERTRKMRAARLGQRSARKRSY